MRGGCLIVLLVTAPRSSPKLIQRPGRSSIYGRVLGRHHSVLPNGPFDL
jgi:hypothetical protein